jgi:hypothetical protein
LPPGSTAVSQRIPEPTVPLGVELVEEEHVDVEPLGPERIRREHAVERVRLAIDNRLPRVDHLQPLRQRRRRTHHRCRLAVDDACLLAVTGSAVDLGTGLVVADETVEGDAREGRGFPLFFRKLDVCRAVLSRTVWLHSSEHVGEHLPLPLQEQERLARLLALAVPKDLLEEPTHERLFPRVDRRDQISRAT